MKAVILAAGVASRLRPLTDHMPKCLLQVGLKKILGLTLDNLIASRITEVVIVTGYLQQQIRDFISLEYGLLDVKYIYNECFDSTNNIYSLWLAKDEILGEDMLLLDSDIVFDKAIITRLFESGYSNCLALKRHDVYKEEIKLKVDPQGRILQIGKEVNYEEAIGESIGIERFNADLVHKLYKILDFKVLVENDVNIFYEAAFQDLVHDGEHIYVVDVTDHFCMEIDTIGDLEVANKMVLEND